MNIELSKDLYWSLTTDGIMLSKDEGKLIKLNNVSSEIFLLVHEFQHLELVIEQLRVKYGHDIEDIIRQDVNEFIKNMRELNIFILRGDKSNGCEVS